MHGALDTPVLSLAPDSIASLGELDATSLSDLWGVFTKCKDSLQNGRRLENLSWRLWYSSSRSETKSYLEGLEVAHQGDGAVPSVTVEEGWSDPEWTEATSDSESEEEEEVAARSGRPDMRRSASSAATLGQQTAVVAPPRPALPPRGISNCTPDRRTACNITGGSLNRIIKAFETQPAIAAPAKARSVIDVPLRACQVLADSSSCVRGASAPDVLQSPLPDSASLPSSPSNPLVKVDAPTQTTPRPSAPPTPKPAAHSPVLSRANIISADSDSPPPPPVRSPAALLLSRSLSSTKPRMAGKSSLTTALSSSPSFAMSSMSSSQGAHPERVPQPGAFAPINRSASQITLARNASSASMEPRSYVKGFDMSMADAHPSRGSIAPPPTPAPPPSMKLPGTTPPSAMKSTAAPGPAAKGKGKKIFFISSPTSDSDDDSSPPSRRGSSTHSHRRVSPRAPAVSPASVPQAERQPTPSRLPPVGRPPPIAAVKAQEDEGEWDDEDDSDASSESSGWGSEYSTESDEETGNGRKSGKGGRNQALFTKRASVSGSGELKRPGPGLLSQLFHPSMMEDNVRRHSTADLTSPRATTKALPHLPTSKSAGMLTEKLKRNKSFLRGAPQDVEMESSSEEEDGDGFVDESSSAGSAQGHALASALALQERQLVEAAIAAPQSPRTTRRAMLATELSESLRRNLIWERQTRNRALGGPLNARFQPTPPPAPSSASGAVHSALPPRMSSEGLRAPHPSPATRYSSPVAPMVRRHTTGTGLYALAQKGKLSRKESSVSSSDSSDGSDNEEEEEEQGPTGALGKKKDVFRDAFSHGGLHDHGW